ncbi:adenosylcobinamide-GDP ribazoletransferase [Clostridium botulinum]|uniref:Adenosylcobinamide-GDP ribazoletransferase n=2 Tax=Clostridium botulinum TaxID=1491 RepID=COBS_CLOB6|nr:adenosylcobinamide-GDP ribazoletransferase [Clostridium botulinum]C3L2A5.1 RecName: Full=Adenosylcobinamide-GDP ribazoletransferase; AltName: Full=Cobalamin synthase; AltName: Full=Cobalamin-5'-phosphate synthase [Clostridium botulinum Ba4 str. 657]AJD27997.1 cobalamin 5'-phosphate synthase [Clostridium botulinum CDC_297]ACQ53773.1 cobalamin 5'-phosphate synthase [Clostridium botulinum Ba4 str. 657]AJE10328.1 cobalamin 5'-phosphate synthase [Clostridium botulinum CDC_1436]APU59704.1 cobalam
MKSILNDFLLMIQFFTRIPINKNLQCEKVNFRRGAFFLPVVASIIGGMEFLIYLGLKNFLPPNVIIVLLLLFTAMITGGLHMDGLADTCDGFFSLRDKERIIEIMKDSRMGAFGTIAMIINLLLKYQLLYSLVLKDCSIAIILAPVIGRISILFLCLSKRTAKKNGSGNIFIGNMSKPIIFLITIIALAMNTYFLELKITIISFTAVLIITYLFYLLCLNKINGLTGDTLGACNELGEITFLLILLMM